MKNFGLLQNQAAMKNRPVTNEPFLPAFKGENIPYFSNISENSLSDLIKSAKTVRYVKKEVLASVATPSSLVVVFLGKVSLKRKDDNNSDEISFQIQDSYGGNGEIALLTDELRSATAVNLENAVFAVISKADFDNWQLNYLDVNFAFLPILPRKLDS